MASSNDYTVEANCTAVNQFTYSSNLGTPTLRTGADGTANSAIQLDKGSNLGTTTTETVTRTIGTGFRLDQQDFLLFFNYVKGKGAAVLTDTATTVVIRVWCGAVVNGDFIDFHFGGDTTLVFGWQTLACSGLNYDASSGTWQDSDITQNVTQIQLRLEYRGDGGVGYNPPPIGIDDWRRGTGITLGTGTGTASLADLKTYSDNNNLGVVTELAAGAGYILDCDLTLGDGTSGVNEANLVVTGQLVLFRHFSEEVKHGLTISNNSTARFGQLVTGTGARAPYAVDGCQLVVSSVVNFAGTVQSVSGYATLDVEDGGGLELYDCKLFRWQDINLGVGTTAGTQITLNRVDVDSCNRIRFRQTNLEASNLDIHDNRGRNDVDGDDQCGEMTKEPDLFANVVVHDCAHGIYFRETLSVDEYIARDNVTYDLGILEGKTVTIIDGEFLSTKIVRQAT